MRLDIALGLCYFRSQLQVSDGAAGTADWGQDQGAWYLLVAKATYKPRIGHLPAKVGR